MSKLADKDGLKKFNNGTTFLTSPMNYATNPKIIESTMIRKELILRNVDSYATQYEPDPRNPLSKYRKKSPE